MADDSDGEGFYDDPFEYASDGEDFRGDPFDDEEDDDGCLGLCGGPSDEEGDDDSNGEEMCEVPCCYDDDDGSDSEDLCGTPRDDDDDDGLSEGALSDDDDVLQDEEVCDEEGNGGELVDDPCDEDEEEGDGEAQDLREEDPSYSDDEEGEPEVFCVSGSSGADGTDISDSVEGDSSSYEIDDERLTPVSLPLPRPLPAPWVSAFSVADGTDTSDSVEGDSSSEEDDERLTLVSRALPLARPLPASWAFQMALAAEHTDSDDNIDYDTDDTDYDDYELHRLPVSRAAMESLPEAILGKEEATCDCAVCKEVFESAQRIICLPCKHYFHGDCIRPWLAIRSTCPVCRYQLPTDDSQSRQGQAHQLRVLEPVAPHSETQQGGGRVRGGVGGATTGAGDAHD